ncbi:hypothetical protein B9Z55_025310 [Caenorhabditis nigoni]|uniref:Uncharacterized protein n=1 Tax=Caenorhabditis nigoni TaxID=1611254 RepID=A0A2G5SYA8_9PELO|nr:hypothetical protein B9Z55_025310 [Caenorhabditis nigoni]
MSDSLPSPNGTVPEKFLQLREQRIRVHTDRLNGWLLLDVSNPEVVRDLEKITDENSLIEFEKKREIWAALQNVNFPAPEVRFAPKRTAFNINAVPFQPRISVIEAPRFVLPIVPKSYKLGTPEAAPIFSRIHEKKKESKIRIEVTLADDECSSISDKATEEPSITESKEAGHEKIVVPVCHLAKNNNKKSKTGKNKNKSGKKSKNDVESTTSEIIEQPNIDVEEVTEGPAITDTKEADHENVDLDEKERTGCDEVKSLSHEKAPNPEAIFDKSTILVLSSGQASEKKTIQLPPTHVLSTVGSGKSENGSPSTLSLNPHGLLFLDENKIIPMTEENGNNSIQGKSESRQVIVGLDEEEQTSSDKVESLHDEKTQRPQAIFKDDDFPVLSSGKKGRIEPSPNHVFLPLGSGTLSSRLSGGLPTQDKNKVASVKKQNDNNAKTGTWAAVVKSKLPVEPSSAAQPQSVNRVKTRGSSVSSKRPAPSSSRKTHVFPVTFTLHNSPKAKKFDEDGFEMVINGASTSEIAIKIKRKIVIEKKSPSSSTSSPSIPSSSEPSSATPSLSSSTSPQKKKKKPSNQKKLKNVLKVTEDDLLAMELGIEENKKWGEKKKAEEEKMKEEEEAKAQEELQKLKEDEKKKAPEENRETILEEDEKEVTAEEMKEYREELAMNQSIQKRKITGVAVQAFEEHSIGHKEQQVINKKVKGFCSSMKKLKGKKHSHPMVVPFDHREPKDVTNKRDIDNGNLLDIRIKYANKEGDPWNMFLAVVFGAFRESYCSQVGPTLIELFGQTDSETYMAREELFIKTLFNDQGKMLKSVGY